MANKPIHPLAIGNEITTSLSSSVSDSDTSLPVASATGMNANGGYVIIDEGLTTEEVVYVESVFSNVLTVATNGRGLAGTSAASHDSGATVTDIIVADHVNGPRGAFLLEHNDDGTHKASVGAPIGTVSMYAGSTAPAGWLLCNGEEVSRTIYEDLFNIIGEDYGAGDESTTFNVPNMKQSVPVGLDGSDPDFDALGKTGGAKTHALTADENGEHTHVQNSHNHSQNPHGHRLRFATAAQAGGNSDTGSSTGDNWKAVGTWVENTTATNIAATATNQNSGQGNPHNNMQPFIVLNFIIKY